MVSQPRSASITPMPITILWQSTPVRAMHVIDASGAAVGLFLRSISMVETATMLCAAVRATMSCAAGTVMTSSAEAVVRDTLIGGAGNDIFQHGQVTIEDFQASAGQADKIDLHGLAGATDFASVMAHAHDVGGNVLLDFGAGEQMTLDHVSAASVASRQFLVVKSQCSRSGGGKPYAPLTRADADIALIVSECSWGFETRAHGRLVSVLDDRTMCDPRPSCEASVFRSRTTMPLRILPVTHAAVMPFVWRASLPAFVPRGGPPEFLGRKRWPRDASQERQVAHSELLNRLQRFLRVNTARSVMNARLNAEAQPTHWPFLNHVRTNFGDVMAASAL